MLNKDIYSNFEFLQQHDPLFFQLAKGAEDAFAKSTEIPIPLALIYAGEPSNRSSISFTDGITRTIWLIANQALSFPIFMHGAESANLLNNLVGLADQPTEFKSLLSELNIN